MSEYVKSYTVPPSETVIVWVAATLGDPDRHLLDRLAQAAFMYMSAKADLDRVSANMGYVVRRGDHEVTLWANEDGSLRVESRSKA